METSSGEQSDWNFILLKFEMMQKCIIAYHFFASGACSLLNILELKDKL